MERVAASRQRPTEFVGVACVEADGALDLYDVKWRGRLLGGFDNNSTPGTRLLSGFKHEIHAGIILTECLLDGFDQSIP